MATFTLYLPDRLLARVDEVVASIPGGHGKRSSWIRGAVEAALYMDEHPEKPIERRDVSQLIEEMEPRKPPTPKPARSPKSSEKIPEETPLPKIAKRHWG